MLKKKNSVPNMKGMGYGELDNNEKHGWMGLVAFFYPSVY